MKHRSLASPSLRSGRWLGMTTALCMAMVLLAAPLRAQANDPLRKTDLIRYLSGGTMTTTQIAQLVARNCVSFVPTPRDRQNLIALGADTMILARIDTCIKARTTAAATPTTPAVAPTPTPTVRPPAPTVRPTARPTAAPTPTVVPDRPTARPPEPATPPPPARLEAVPLSTHVQAVVGGTAVVGVALKRGTAPVSGTRLVLHGSGRLTGPGGADAEADTDERGIAQFKFPAGSAAGTTRLSVATLTGDALSAPAEVELATMMPLLPPSALRPAPDRTGFVQGTGQRGTVGEPAPLPLVFEVRDSAGRAMVGMKVALAVVNGRLAGTPPPTEAATDSSGHVSVSVIFGERAGVATVVSGAVGPLVRQATLYPAPATPRQLVVLLDGNAVTGQVVLAKSRPAVLRIFSRDGFGNSGQVAGLRATSGDERMLKITEVTTDSLGGVVTVTATKTGMTSLVILGSGLRADFSALVR